MSRRSLEAHANLALLEAALIRAEQAAGRTPPHANRPTYPHERHADFADVDRFQQIAYHDTASALRGLKTSIMASMAQAVDGAEDPARLMGAIRTFGTEQTPLVREAINTSTRQIAESLASVQHTAAQSLLNEAGRQGALGAATAGSITGAAYTDQAAAGPAVLWQRLNGAAAAAATPTATPDDVLNAADTTSTAAATDNTRQQIHYATGTGRMESIGQLPQPKRVYASELLDGETCDNCAPIDGHEYATLDDGLIDYPNAAGYIDCLGGDRCRGTLVLVWDEDDSYPTDGIPTPQPPVTDPNRPDLIDQPPLPEAQPVPEGIDPTEPYAVAPETMNAQDAEAALMRAFEHPNFGTDPAITQWSDQLTARLDAIDAAEQATILKAQRLKQARAKEASRSKRRRVAKQQKIDAEWGRLITEEGIPEMDALAEAANISRDEAARRVIMQRTGNLDGPLSFNDVIKSEYDAYLERVTMDAENATNGNMFSRDSLRRQDAGQISQQTYSDLWRKNEAYAYNNASEELLSHWDEVGRVSYVEYRDRMMADDWKGLGGDTSTGATWRQ